MLDQRRLIRQLEWFTVACLSKFREDQRQDSPALEAFLKLSTPEILDQQKLRRRLRQLATSLTIQKRRQLQALLGRSVPEPSPGLIAGWIDDQVEAIQFTVQQWLTTSVRQISAAAASGTAIPELTSGLRVLAQVLGKNAQDRASFRLLQLNGQIIEEVSRGAGSTHYRWITEADSRVRLNHQPLHEQIQSWSEPPPGGGTRPSDMGHPGSGFGCRCIAEPLPGRAPLNAFG